MEKIADRFKLLLAREHELRRISLFRNQKVASMFVDVKSQSMGIFVTSGPGEMSLSIFEVFFQYLVKPSDSFSFFFFYINIPLLKASTPL